ncbi:MAG: helix-turn-helix transcriptional regulator [Crinalium sp.]
MPVICKLKDLMEERGLNQAQVARATKLSPTIIGNLYRNNFKRIDCDTAQTLKNFFACKTMNELFDFAD